MQSAANATSRQASARELIAARRGEPCRACSLVASWHRRGLADRCSGRSLGCCRRASPSSALAVLRLRASPGLTAGAPRERDARRASDEVGEPQAQPAAAEVVDHGRAAGAGVLGAGPARCASWRIRCRACPACRTAPQSLLRFGHGSSRLRRATLKTGLDALFADGPARSTSSCARVAGGHVEAEGRAAGGRAILRLRDVAGLSRRGRPHPRPAPRARARMRASRALLDALPMPVWLRGSDGRLNWVNNAYVQAVEARSERRCASARSSCWSSASARPSARALATGRPTASACRSSSAASARRTT